MRNYATLNKKHLLHNINTIRSVIPAACQIYPVLKANAYGHGIREVAHILQETKIDGFCVADIEEALILRDIFAHIPILYFGPLSQTVLVEGETHRIDLTVRSNEDVALMAQYARPLTYQLKLDTGMHRLGFSRDQWPNVGESLRTPLKHHRLRAMYTHFSSSCAADTSITAHQTHIFNEAPAVIQPIGKVLLHAANSGAALFHPQTHFDLVRPGLAIYGHLDSPQIPLPPPIALRPVLEWKAHLIQVREIQAGDAVGYDRAFVARKKMRIGVVSVGYGDGYSRLYNNAWITLNNKTCPILGKICMDMLMIDLNEVPEAKVGDTVNLLGGQKGACDVATLSKVSGLSIYEVLCSISDRVLRQLV